MDLLQEAKALFPTTQQIRRIIHQHPELAFREYKTSELVIKELTKLGLEVKTGIAETGVVCLIEGEFSGPTILLRCDMDALPIQEQNQTPYASQVSGCMHACGHDGHVAIGLAVAKLLCSHRHELHGTVKLLFQPGEEGAGGAEKMIVEGALLDPVPEACFGLHIWNEKPVGWLGVASGPVMAATSTFDLEITGKGGHGAIPHLAKDPIVAMATIITASQTIVSRSLDPLQPCVVSFCAVNGGEAFNVIPETVKLKGTIRSFDEGAHKLAEERLAKISTTIANGFDCTAEIRISNLTSPVTNDSYTTSFVTKSAKTIFPNLQLDPAGFTTMGAEDFSSFQKFLPGTFFFVGSKNESKGLVYGHHHPQFDFDESALTSGTALMVQIALTYNKRS